MRPHLSSLSLPLVLALAMPLTRGADAQQQTPKGAVAKPTDSLKVNDVRFEVPGTVVDLAPDGAGRILYVTAEKEVGRLVPGGPRRVLATSANANFPNGLRAVAATPTGDVAVLDLQGHVRVLAGGTPPATLVYSDLYMISDATDLIVDARGSFLIASATPSSVQRAVNWIQSDGQRWGYYLVRHQPLQLASDPLTGGLLIAETTGGGNLQLVQAGSVIRATTPLDASTHPGISAAADDGDIALDAEGNVYWIAQGKVYFRDRLAGTTTLLASGFQQLRGLVIAPTSPFPGSASMTGYSLYVSEGANPSRVREIPNVGAPASPILADQGVVPGRGVKVNVTFGFQAYELTADNAGRLLVGGSQFGSTHFIKRVTLSGTPSIAVVANNGSGLAGIVEGLCVAPDDSIYALTRDGKIQHVTEGPLTVTTVFSDPFDQITAGKDLALDLDGTLYVATRESWDFGKVMAVSGGSASLLKITEETRGLAANPLGGMYVSQWHNVGFHGTVDLLHFADNSLETLPGFLGMNYTNDFVWGDGDICVDAEGNVYTISEDDWCLVRYDAGLDGLERIGSGYLNHPSGLAIAPSTATSGSTTGWSLYICEFDNLWEKPSYPAPATTLVDSTLGFHAARSVAATPDPRLGKPRVLAASGHGGLIGTSEGRLLAFDARTGEVRTLAGPDEGLRGDLVAVSASADGRRALALNESGELFLVTPGRARALDVDPARVASVLAHARANPQRDLRLRDPLTGADEWFALDGWVVWRVRD